MNDKSLELIPKRNTILDYDNEPIIIRDYNSLFIFLLNISLIPIVMYIYIYNPGGLDEGSLFRNTIIVSFFIGFFIRPYLKSKGKRKIVLTNNDIKFKHENKILEEIKSVSNLPFDYRKVFLADGNPMVLKTSKLLTVLKTIKTYLPSYKSVYNTYKEVVQRLDSNMYVKETTE